MGLTSLQVCMDSSDWLQGTIHDENGMDISSSPSGEILTCSRPLMERRLRPPHDQALKCPRCDSNHTKFCYYNNYSLSQPRYFCKTCRRYWTKGGTLRNIPVGGGCRKNNKKVTNSKKPNHDTNLPSGLIMNTTHTPGSSSSSPPPFNPTDLQMSHLMGANFYGNYGTTPMIDNPNPRPIDFMVESSRNYDFMGSGELGLVAPNFHALCSPYGMTLDGNYGSNEALMLPYEDQNTVDMKPNTKLLALEWQDQGFSDNGKDSFGYVNAVGSSWGGLINGYGSSTRNPL